MARVRDRKKEEQIEIFGKAANDIGDSPLAKRDHKTITYTFNKYEYDRIEAAREKTGESRQAYIRRAVNELIGN